MASFDGKMTRARKEKVAEVSKVHVKTFMAWINASLRKRGLEVKDLEKDLADGTVLIALVECLTDRPFEKKIHPRPVTLPIHQMENVAMALEFMKPYTNLEIDAKDIVDGKTKIILGLVWRLILNFQVMEVREDHSKSSAVERNNEAKSKLIKWLTEQTSTYDEVAVTDVTESFSDGLAFCALIHKYNPTLIDWEKVQKMDAKTRLALAFKLADEELGIPVLLDPADVTATETHQRPDEQCYMTYLSEFPRAFLAQVQDEVGHGGDQEGALQSAFVSPAQLKVSLKERVAAEDPRAKQAMLEAKQRELEEAERKMYAAHEEARAAAAQAEAEAQAKVEEGRRAREAETQAAQLAVAMAQQADASRRAEAEAYARHAAHAQAQADAARVQAEQALGAKAREAAEAQAAQAAAMATAHGEAQRAAQAQAQAEAARRAEAQAAEHAAASVAAAQQMANELERIRRENEALRKNLAQISSTTLAKLRVVVVGARNLPGTDFFTGKADPYVTLTLERQKEKTKTLKNTVTPRWDAAYTFYVSEPNAELVATVWDWERLSRDAFLGHVVLPIKDMSANVEKEQWYTLMPKKVQGGIKVKGEICLRVVLQKNV